MSYSRRAVVLPGVGCGRRFVRSPPGGARHSGPEIDSAKAGAGRGKSEGELPLHQLSTRNHISQQKKSTQKVNPKKVNPKSQPEKSIKESNKKSTPQVKVVHMNHGQTEGWRLLLSQSVGAYLTRVAFGTTLLASIAIVYAAITVILTSAKRWGDVSGWGGWVTCRVIVVNSSRGLFVSMSSFFFKVNLFIFVGFFQGSTTVSIIFLFP